MKVYRGRVRVRGGRDVESATGACAYPFRVGRQRRRVAKVLVERLHLDCILGRLHDFRNHRCVRLRRGRDVSTRDGNGGGSGGDAPSF